MKERNEELSFDELVEFAQGEEEENKSLLDLLKTNGLSTDSDNNTFQNASNISPHNASQHDNRFSKRNLANQRCYNCNQLGHHTKNSQSLIQTAQNRQQHPNHSPPQRHHSNPHSQQYHGQMQAQQRQGNMQPQRNLSYTTLLQHLQTPPQVIACINQITAKQPSLPTIAEEDKSAIRGELMLNRERIGYLCDPGATITLIHRKLYDKINKQDQPKPLRLYKGPNITSCNMEMKVLGVISYFSVKHDKIIVVDKLVGADCIVGRDLTARIPAIYKPLQEVRETVENLTHDLIEHVDEIIERELWFSDEDEEETIDSREIVVFPGFQDNRPTVIEYRAPPTENKSATYLSTYSHYLTQKSSGFRSEEEMVRDILQKELEDVAASQVADIDLEANRHMEFVIKLINPNTRPIKCKPRPIPFKLGDMVKAAIDEQLTSNWRD